MKNSILWVDDEIDLLKVQILFLKSKGYDVTTATNGTDALELFEKNTFDIVFLDEYMPGITGLDVLHAIRNINADIPVVMITKNEGEDIMDEAVGSRVSDYLIKPVNPNQILLSLKKNIDNKRLVSQKTAEEYKFEFQKLGQEINQVNNIEEWKLLYKKLVDWELKLQDLNEDKTTLSEIFNFQKNEADSEFTKYVVKNYENWISGSRENRPLMQIDVFKERVMPMIESGQKVFWIVIDNLRFDQWKVLQPLITEYLAIEKEEMICSILPTATQYARNAMFSGLMPLQISQLYPELWTDEDELHSKNNNEEKLIQTMLKRFRLDIKYSYAKTFVNKDGQKINDSLNSISNNMLNIAVYNFVDMISHARTDNKMMRELADDVAAYRAITKTWFEHSSLYSLIKMLANLDFKVIFTTDHGTVKVNNPIKISGEKEITSNLRYKMGKDLQFNKKEVFEAKDPNNVQLPSPSMTTKYIFAKSRDFFAYPNNYNHYVKYYKDTLQHGGVSMEEMLIPLITLKPKNSK